MLGHHPQMMMTRAWFHLSVVITISLTLIGSTTAGWAQIEKDDWSLLRTDRAHRWRAPQRFGTGGVLALTFTDPERDHLTVATEEPRKGGDMPRRVLAFYVRKGSVFVETHRFTTSYHFVSMFSNIAGNRLITTWASGSAFRTGIFALDQNDVRVVLWVGWKWPVEFVDLDGDREPEVVHASDGVAGAAPTKAVVYRWSGRGYQRIGDVPWVERYRGK